MALTMITAWTLLASALCFVFLQVVPDKFEARGYFLMDNVSLYGFCLLFRAVDFYFPEAFYWSLNFFVAGVQVAMLFRQCTMFRFVLAIGTSNRGQIVSWNVLFAITGIYRGLTLRCGMFAGPDVGVQWQPQIIFKTACIVVGMELLFISAILDAQESENEKVAAQRMLAVLCDSQMMLDSELRISGRHESSARFLQVPSTAAAGCQNNNINNNNNNSNNNINNNNNNNNNHSNNSSNSLDGVDFTDFVDPVDVSRFKAFMRGRTSWPSGGPERPESPEARPDEEGEQRRQDAPPKPAGSLHVQMFNGLRRPFKVNQDDHVEESEPFANGPIKLKTSESFAAFLLNECDGEAGELDERVREQEKEEEEENAQETAKSRPRRPSLRKELLSMRAFETGDLLQLKVGSAASACSSSSASSSCASKALPMFPGLQDLVACLSPFSPGLEMNFGFV
ncbi:unnamed protein product [Polarella glacialis]|uniref:Uncharacterized protein n=1 Tax=Polarella glacialis TaxID=89957 RepID=A0A813EHV1_POLGL|nr:unnamed protein product [Polarella glacialis]CAE8627213.1 unnamed protein product [Polarella glacialis]